MEANLENAIDTLRMVAESCMTDGLGHLRMVTTVAVKVLAFLDAAGEIETHDLKDAAGRVIKSGRRLKLRGADTERPPMTAVAAAMAMDEDSDLAFRTRNACDQLTRYSGSVASEELADLLDQLADLNDNVWHGRSPIIIYENAEAMKALLYRIAST